MIKNIRKFYNTSAGKRIINAHGFILGMIIFFCVLSCLPPQYALLVAETLLWVLVVFVWGVVVFFAVQSGLEEMKEKE